MIDVLECIGPITLEVANKGIQTVHLQKPEIFVAFVEHTQVISVQYLAAEGSRVLIIFSRRVPSRRFGYHKRVKVN